MNDKLTTKRKTLYHIKYAVLSKTLFKYYMIIEPVRNICETIKDFIQEKWMAWHGMAWCEQSHFILFDNKLILIYFVLDILYYIMGH